MSYPYNTTHFKNFERYDSLPYYQDLYLRPRYSWSGDDNQRSVGSPVVVPQQLMNDVTHGGYTFGIRAQSHSAAIYDVITNPHGFNPCLHNKRRSAEPSAYQRIVLLGATPFSIYCKTSAHIRVNPGSWEPENWSTPDWGGMINDLADDLNGAITDGVPILVSLAEASKTIQMVRNPFNLLKTNWRKAAKNLSARKLVKSGANIWLEKKYGWDSAIADVRNVSSTVSDCLSKGANSLFEDGYSRVSQSQSETVSSGSWVYPKSDQSNWEDGWASYCTGWHGGVHQPSFRYKANRSIIYSVSCHQMQDLGQRWSRFKKFQRAFGIDTRGLFESLWEVVPFSFVVDWFVDPLGLWRIPASLARLKAGDITHLGYTKVMRHQINVEVFPGYKGWDASPFNNYLWHYGFQKLYGSVAYHDCFHRVVGTPPATSLITSCLGKGLSMVNGISGTALVTQLLS